jgi:hypothetical protein
MGRLEETRPENEKFNSTENLLQSSLCMEQNQNGWMARCPEFYNGYNYYGGAIDEKRI